MTVLTAIEIALGLSALYGFAMWLFVFVLTRLRQPRDEDARATIEQFTFRVGICAIAASGFLGIILSLQGK